MTIPIIMSYFVPSVIESRGLENGKESLDTRELSKQYNIKGKDGFVFFYTKTYTKRSQVENQKQERFCKIVINDSVSNRIFEIDLSSIFEQGKVDVIEKLFNGKINDAIFEAIYNWCLKNNENKENVDSEILEIINGSQKQQTESQFVCVGSDSRITTASYSNFSQKQQ